MRHRHPRKVHNIAASGILPVDILLADVEKNV